MAELTGQFFAGYEIIAKLGQGGMGAVYKAKQPVLNRIVALKVMSPQIGDDPAFIARFLREASSAAKLNHANMVLVHTAGQSDGIYYIVMEFVDGLSLQEHITNHGRLDAREAVATTVYVAEALKYAWEKAQIIHRDIKPANIFLSNAGEVKVGDLGLAKSVGQSTAGLTQTGMMMGSPNYVAPEQARGVKDIDYRADIYSLGCTLYHMLTGRPPYEGEDSMAIMHKHIYDPPPAIFKVLPGCPVPLGMLVGKMLSKRREQRPQDYEELIADLLAIHHKLPVPGGQRVSAAAAAAAEVKKRKASPGAEHPPPHVGGHVAEAGGQAAAQRARVQAPTMGTPAVPEARRKRAMGLGAWVIGGAAAVAALLLAGMFLWSPWKTRNADTLVRGVSSRPDSADKSVRITPAAAAAALKLLGKLYTNAVGAEMVYIPPGEFMQGSTKEEQAWALANKVAAGSVEREGDGPRKATIKQGFWMGRTEVTVGQWKQFVKETGYVTDGEKNGESYVPTPGEKKGESYVPTPGGSVTKKGVNWRNPNFGFEMRDDHPVCCISWNDAVAFCEWLTERERKAGRLEQGYTVRLPTEAEWEYACRAGTQTKFWWGDSRKDGQGRLNWTGKDDGFEFVASVDSFGGRGRNPFGLADMLGNVLEWCLDEYDLAQAHEDLWIGSPGARVLRGGSFYYIPADCRSASRGGSGRSVSSNILGFRVVTGVNVFDAGTLAASTSSAAPPREAGILAPAETRVSALTTNPKVGDVFTLEVGKGVTMELIGIPPGEFMLGSTKEEQAWAVANGRKEEEVKREGEAPRKATIKQGLWMGRTTVTVGQWKQFAQETGYLADGEKKGESYVPGPPGKPWVPKKGVSWKNPDFGFEMRDNHPVSCVSWNDAMAFCDWLTARERKAGRLPAGLAMRLPTEAEWEYACRAGTQTKWWWGDVKEGGRGRLNWFGKEDGYEFVSPVDSFGERGRNGFGLADMLGNVWQWCLDEFDATQPHEELWSGDAGARVLRGGAFNCNPAYCRCADRTSIHPSTSNSRNGFRVVVGLEPGATSVPITSHESRVTTPAVDDSFVREVAALPAEQQVQRVMAKLKELNPGFDGKEEHKIENGGVTELQFPADAVSDISPVRALKALTSLTCSRERAGRRTPLTDLSPLASMSLTKLYCPLSSLEDLSPLRGMPLRILWLNESLVSNLSPLSGMAVEQLFLGATRINDLSPLKGLPLNTLTIDHTTVSDLAPLKGMRLKALRCHATSVADLSILADMPLIDLKCDFVPARDTAILRSIKTLETINQLPAAEFWKRVEAGESPQVK